MVDKAVFGLLMFLAFVSAGFAQDARLGGTVMDFFGAVIPEAKVEVTCDERDVYQASTRADGVFEIKLKGGLCKIRVSKPPFDPSVITGYFIPGNNSMKIDIALQCYRCEINEHQYDLPQSPIDMQETDSGKGFKIVNRPLINSRKDKQGNKDK